MYFRGRVEALRDHPALLEKAASWFSRKWGIPEEAYRESMVRSLARQGPVPQWYLVPYGDTGELIAGAGVIENDFHDRPDLSPNLCSLFVEKPFRGIGIARLLLENIQEDMAAMGVEPLYLVTDHIGFYERCGWRFLTMVRDESGAMERMYVSGAQEQPPKK